MRISDWSSDVCSSDLQNKEAYYLALRQTQRSIRTDAPDWQHWLVFFLRALSQQVHCLDRKVEREKLDRKSVVQGKSVSVRVDPGGRRIIKKKYIRQKQMRR